MSKDNVNKWMQRDGYASSLNACVSW